MQNTPLSAPLNPGAARPARDVFLREVGLRELFKARTRKTK